VGKQIDKHLNNLFDEAEEALVKKLDKTTLSEFTNRFN
jgi:hypothetical protein